MSLIISFELVVGDPEKGDFPIERTYLKPQNTLVKAQLMG